jgi:ADP-heptose:LPS heptosyltransferase
MQHFNPPASIGISLPKKAVVFGLGVLSGLVRLRAARNRTSTAKPKVVLLEPFGMGDAISLLPLVQLLHEHEFGVIICARPAWRSLFPDYVEWIDCSVPWASYGDGEKYQLKSLLGGPFRDFLKRLRALASGHIGLDTRGDARSTLLLWIAGCQTVYSLDRYLGSDLKNIPWAARALRLESHLRRWQVNAQFISPLTGSSLQPGRPQIARHLGPASQSRPHGIGIIPITPWPGRAWPAPCWQELIQQLLDAGETVIAMGGPGQEASLRQAVGPNPSLILCTSMTSWIERLSGLEAVIAIDSGPTHLVDALGLPLVALYGSGQLPLWAPSGPRSLALHRQNDPDYTPIHPVDANISRGLELMARHTVEDVLHALADVRQRAATVS